MNILSLFDGISCAKVALAKANINVSSYRASEIDKYAIEVSKKNHPGIIHIGNVKDISCIDIPIDIMIGGSPCQDLSIAKQGRKGLDGDRSSLFWEYVRIKNLCNPKWFILENVASMRKQDRDIITKTLGVEPIMIDASLVSAQSRKRLFWTNISATQPEDKAIKLKDIIQPDVATKYYIKGYTLTSNDKETGYIGFVGNGNSQGNRVYSTDNKSVCLSANGGGLGAKTGLYKIGSNRGRRLNCDDDVRRLTPIECERLQGLPDNYTDGISDTQRYKCLGNAFNVDVISHILSFLPGENSRPASFLPV
jgi:DNA-cytosine methyltransferase